MNASVLIPSTELLASLKAADICPTFISTNRLLQLLREVCKTNSSNLSTNYEVPLSFTKFLIFLSKISDEIQESSASTADYNGNKRLRSMLIFFSISSLRRVLSSITSDHNTDPTNSPTSLSSSQISLSSMLWLMRQSGFTQSDLVQIPAMSEKLILEMTKCSFDHKSDENISIDSKYVPVILARLVHKFYKVQQALPTIDLTSSSRKDETIFASHTIFLSIYLPGSLFALTSNSIMLRCLPTLYSHSIISKLTAQQDLWNSVLSNYLKYRISQDASILSNVSLIVDFSAVGWTIDSFVRYAKSLEFLPKVITVEGFKEIAKYIVWPFGQHPPSFHTVILPLNDLLEILFAISQQLISRQVKNGVNMTDEIMFMSYKVLLEKLLPAKSSDNRVIDEPHGNSNDPNQSKSKESSTRLTPMPSQRSLTASVPKTINRIDREPEPSGYRADNDNSFQGTASIYPSPISSPETGKLSNRSRNIRIETNPSESTPQRISPSNIQNTQLLSEAMMLLLFFPMQSFRFNPWEISQIFLTVTQSQNIISQHSDALSGIFALFCDKYTVLPGKLAKFYAARYEEPKVMAMNTPISMVSPSKIPSSRSWDQYKENGLTVMRSSIAQVIHDPVLNYIIEDKTLRLLYSNCDLLKFEYSKSFSKYCHDSYLPLYPIPATLDHPILSCQKILSKENNAVITQSYLLPQYAAISWAIDNTPQISRQTVEIYYNMIAKCCLEIEGHGLTFSTFILFAIKCYTHNIYFQQRISMAGQSNQSLETTKITLNTFLDAVRDMLMVLSKNLTSLQQSMRIRVLNPLFNGFPSDSIVGYDNVLSHSLSSPRHKASLLTRQDIQSILQHSMNLFKEFNAPKASSFSSKVSVNGVNVSLPKIDISTYSSSVKFIPPRPPDFYWDAPRYVEYCKYVGVVNSLGISSMACSWYGYGGYLRSLNPPGLSSWSPTVVPPLPIKPDVNALIMMIEYLVQLSSDENMMKNWAEIDVSMNKLLSNGLSISHGFQFIVSKIILPLVCANHEKSSINIDIKKVISFLPLSSLSLPLSYQWYLHSMNSSLEDIIRYGGDQVIMTMDALRPWIISSYQSLVKYDADTNDLSYFPSKDRTMRPSTAEKSVNTCMEPNLLTICNYFSCQGMLLQSTIIHLAFQSFHHRLRPTDVYGSIQSAQNTDISLQTAVHAVDVIYNIQYLQEILFTITLSISEYEELFLRCSFVAWELSGAAGKFSLSSTEFLAQKQKQESFLNQILSLVIPSMSKDYDRISIILSQCRFLDTIPSPEGFSMNLQQICRNYCDECNKAAMDRNSMTSNSSIRTTWGVDYVKPFHTIMRQYSQLPDTAIPLLTGLEEIRESKDWKSQANINTSGLVNMNLLEAHLEMKANSNEKKLPSHPDNYRIESPLSLDKRLLTESGIDISSPIVESYKDIDIMKGDQVLQALDLNISITKQRLYRDRYLTMQTANTNPIASTTPLKSSTQGSDVKSSMDKLASKRLKDSFEAIPGKPSSDESQQTNIKANGLSDVLADRYDHYIADPVIRQHNQKAMNRDNVLSIDKSKPIDLSFDIRNKGNKSMDTHADFKPSALIPSESLSSIGNLYSYSQTNINASLLEGTKEMLWPVYATYCSCGDSNEPGKLSGPNLFALLSKLGLLTDTTVLSDIGILLHQISSHSHAHSPLGLGILTTMSSSSNLNGNGNTLGSSDDIWGDSPSLTFEEFLIYLCAFSQLRFEGQITAPIFSAINIDEKHHSERINDNKSMNRLQSSRLSRSTSMGKDGETTMSRSSGRDQARWFEHWQRYMSSSASFRRLLEECIVPVLNRHPVLASPDDARTRDKFSLIFSLEVLLAIEGAEQPLLSSFEYERDQLGLVSDMNASVTSSPSSTASIRSIQGSTNPSHNSSSISLTQTINSTILSSEKAFLSMLQPLERMNLIPQVMTISQIRQLIVDIIPNKDKSNHNSSAANNSKDINVYSHIMTMLRFPTWEWIIAIIAFQAVENAVRVSDIPTDPLVSPQSHPKGS